MLRHSEVLGLDRLNEQLADTVEIENLLSYNETAHKKRELDADNSEDREHCVLKRVAIDNDFLSHAFRSRSSNIVLSQYLK